MSVVISVGNSDDRLSQHDWHRLCSDVRRQLVAHEVQLHGEWFSAPMTAFQNAAWCFDIAEPLVDRLRHWLGVIAHEYGQDSISWLEGETEFVGPKDKPTLEDRGRWAKA